MPTFAANHQKNFKLTIVDGLPQAAVEDLDGIHWLRCCPLCGCTHQILNFKKDTPYTPLCQTLPLVYKSQQASWQKLYPAAAQYETLRLVVGKGK